MREQMYFRHSHFIVLAGVEMGRIALVIRTITSGLLAQVHLLVGVTHQRAG